MSESKALKLEQIVMYHFHCTPVEKTSESIRSMTIVIYAKDKEDAERIYRDEFPQFIHQRMNIVKEQKFKGMRQVK